MARRPASAAFDTPVALRRAVTARDAMNAPVETWATFARVLARREPSGGGEQVAAGQPAVRAVERFLIRLTPTVADLAETDQLVCAGVAYGLERIEPVTGEGRRGRYLRIHATAQPGVVVE